MNDVTRLKFQERLRNPFFWLGGAIGLIILIIIIFTISLIFRKNPYGDEIRIDNLGEYVQNLPAEKRDAMFNMLYSRVSMELDDNANDIIPHAGALVRAGSHNSAFDDIARLHSGSFLVDIDALSQTYLVQYEWSENSTDDESSYAVVITCPRPEQVKYENFHCNSINDALSSTDSEAILGNNTPYYSQTASGYAYFIQNRHYTGGKPYVEVNVNSCGSQKVLAEAKSEAEKWLESIGVDISVIPIQMRDLCDGGA